MESKTLTVVMPERMYRELAEYAALLSAKPLRSGRTREYSLEDALLLAAMIYIDDYLYRQRQNVPLGGVSSSPSVSREGSGVGTYTLRQGEGLRQQRWTSANVLFMSSIAVARRSEPKGRAWT